MGSSPVDLNAGAIAPVADEVVCHDLGFEGEIPRELQGVLVRNGPNPFGGRFEGEGMLNWWVGPAMLHGVAFEDGKPLWYRNRWVRTGAWERHRDSSRTVEPLRDQNTNVNVLRHAGRNLALGEGGVPFSITAELETLGPENYGDRLPGGITAHPKLDPETGELRFFRANWQAPFLHYGVLDRQGRCTVSQEIELEEPAMMHDFAMTEYHSLLLDLNVGYDFELLKHGMPMPLRWFDEKQSRIGVVPRVGGPVRWFEIEPCFIQHVVNAYEVGEGETQTIVFDAVRYRDFLRFDAAAGDFAQNPLGTLWRVRLDLQTGLVTECEVDDRAIELPRIDDRRTGRRNRYLFAVEQPTDTEMRGLIRYDTEAGTSERHRIPVGDQNSEPIFVPRGGSAAEGEGWVLSCVYRAATDQTDVLILDATELSAAPVAIVHLPRRIPAGFHGAWLPLDSVPEVQAEA